MPGLDELNERYVKLNNEYIAVYATLERLERSLLGRLLGGPLWYSVRRLVFRTFNVADGLAAEIDTFLEAQKQILDSMEKVRDRNRRLEAQLRTYNLDYAHINGNVMMTDGEWREALIRYGRALSSRSAGGTEPFDEQSYLIDRVIDRGRELAAIEKQYDSMSLNVTLPNEVSL